MGQIQEKEQVPWKDPKASLIQSVFSYKDEDDPDSPSESFLRQVRYSISTIYDSFREDVSTPIPIWDNIRREFILRWGNPTDGYADYVLEQGPTNIRTRLRTYFRQSFRQDDFIGNRLPEFFISAVRACEGFATRKFELPKKSVFKPKLVKTRSTWLWVPSNWMRVKHTPSLDSVQTVLRPDYDSKTILGQSRLRMLKGATAKVQGSSARTNDLNGVQFLYVRVGDVTLRFYLYGVIRNKHWPSGRIQRTEHHPLGYALLVAALGVQRYFHQHHLPTPNWEMRTLKIQGSAAVLDGIIKA